MTRTQFTRFVQESVSVDAVSLNKTHPDQSITEKDVDIVMAWLIRQEWIVVDTRSPWVCSSFSHPSDI